MILYPTYVDPVKATLLTKWWWVNIAPVLPSPLIIFITPGGNPAYCINFPSLRADKGVCYAGFKTIVQPAAKAGAIFHASIIRG